jgi:hypothetical protein
MGWRGVGIRAGNWNVDVPSIDKPRGSPHVGIFLERSIDRKLSVENSISVWRVITTERQSLPPAPIVEISSYIVPLLISLKLYPIPDTPPFAPFLAGGIGLAFGIENEDENSIGGGGSSVVTGFGIRWAAGLEIQVAGGFHVSASARYQWLHFGEQVGGADTYSGLGAEGGLAYRFHF